MKFLREVLGFHFKLDDIYYLLSINEKNQIRKNRTNEKKQNQERILQHSQQHHIFQQGDIFILFVSTLCFYHPHAY